MTTVQLTYYQGLLESERDYAARIHEEKKMAAVDYALETLHADPAHYGLCIVCGCPIDSDRLRIVPATLYCEDDAERRPVTPTRSSLAR